LGGRGAPTAAAGSGALPPAGSIPPEVDAEQYPPSRTSPGRDVSRKRVAQRPRRRLTVLSGPSGAGKAAVVAEIRRTHSQVWLSVSVTTRAARPGEALGVAYDFVDDAEFDRLVAAGELLEWAEVAGNRYGTPRRPVADRLAAGVPVLVEIDLRGARQLRTALPDALLVFLAPPSWGGPTEWVDSAEPLDAVAEKDFDVVLVNTSVQDVCRELLTLMAVPGGAAPTS
jgi:guanylate kinase